MTQVAEYLRKVRAERRAERVDVGGRLVHPRAPHGSASGYQHWSCRCGPCSAANRSSTAATRATANDRVAGRAEP
ncbi:hypothetical protein STSO111631_20015 [Stackebrandtia soli]